MSMNEHGSKAMHFPARILMTYRKCKWMEGLEDSTRLFILPIEKGFSFHHLLMTKRFSLKKIPVRISGEGLRPSFGSYNLGGSLTHYKNSFRYLRGYYKIQGFSDKSLQTKTWNNTIRKKKKKHIGLAHLYKEVSWIAPLGISNLYKMNLPKSWSFISNHVWSEML